ncbi:hypothetical protein EXIGLDRAFT_833798 [Exidia glandulosa HHB12029]|uniref:AAA-ATPase-like domain-containing protein n=1 Tax=Exidia glandulosa HHB12029 TaxID=1314781 RepID=A0A165KDD4_EXIGL|nr:hypothetical protein EXIGLDRAFT_833798 [Exidia glandulosa HHB12029]
MRELKLLECFLQGHQYVGPAPLMLHGLDCAAPITVHELAKVLDNLHDVIECECGRRVALDVAWKTNIPYGEDFISVVENFDPSAGVEVAGSQTLQQLFPNGAPGSEIVSIVLALDPPLPRDVAHALPFEGVRRLRGNICRVSGPNYLVRLCTEFVLLMYPFYYQSKRLPTQADYSVFSAHEASGTYFVDKTDFAADRFAFNNVDHRIPVIRRGAGYGKTTFLSMVVSFLTCPRNGFLTCLRNAQFASPRHDYLFRPFDDVLVLWLDFDILAQSLPPGHDATHPAVVQSCTKFLAEVIEEFYVTHDALLAGNRPGKDDPFLHTYPGLKFVLSERGYRLFVAVDNYTAPFSQVAGTAARYTDIEIWTQILGPILEDLDRFVWRGCITGLDLGPHVRPFSSLPLFKEATQDLTDLSDYVNTIGFTYQEVEDLSRAIYAEDFNLAQEMNIGADMGAPADSHKRSVFCARTIVDVLGRLLQGEAMEEVLANESPVASFYPAFSNDSQLSADSPDPETPESLSAPSF